MPLPATPNTKLGVPSASLAIETVAVRRPTPSGANLSENEPVPPFAAIGVDAFWDTARSTRRMLRRTSNSKRVVQTCEVSGVRASN